VAQWRAPQFLADPREFGNEKPCPPSSLGKGGDQRPSALTFSVCLEVAAATRERPMEKIRLQRHGFLANEGADFVERGAQVFTGHHGCNRF